jgi:hypothetical protein
MRTTDALTCRGRLCDPVWCGAWFGPNPTGGQYCHVAGTQRKTSPTAATWQTEGNDR